MSALTRYLSTAPLLAILFTSLALTAFIFINWASPNLLFLAQ